MINIILLLTLIVLLFDILIRIIFFKNIISSDFDGRIILKQKDNKLIISSCNEYAELLFGEKIKNKNILNYLKINIEKNMKYSKVKDIYFSKTKKWAYGVIYKINFNKFVLILSDITDEKEKENKIRKEQKRMNLAMSASNEGIWEWDLEKNEFNFNKTIEKVLDYNIIELKEKFKDWKSLFSPKDLKKISQKVDACVNNKTDDFTCEIQIKMKNGTLKWIEARGKVIERTQNLKAIRIIGTLSDISKRKNFEKEKEKLLEITQKLFELSPDFILIVDFNQNIVKVSQSILDTFEYKEEELLNKNIKYFLKDSDLITVENTHNKILEGNFINNTKIYMKKKNGTYLPLRISAKASKELKLIFGVGRDVSAEELTLKKLQMAAKKEAEASKLKTNFLANMSHEIRTPLSAIIGAIELLSEYNYTNEQEELINILRSSSDTLLELINNILDLSKIESGHLSFEFIDFSPSIMFENIENIFRPLANKKGINFYLENNMSKKYNLKSDPTRLKQVLVNLISNAIKFTSEGSVSLSINELESNEKTVKLEFKVKDTGIGIPKEKINTIFESFNQADNSITRKFGGTGLGLAISKKIIEKLGGKIIVESVLNAGSTFKFVLEIEKSNKFIEKDNTLNIDTIKSSEITILIAEDNDINQKILKMMLKDKNFNIHMASDGEEAVSLISKIPFDLILMDVQMPKLNGFEATKEIRKHNKNIPIIALTANAMKGYKEVCIKNGMNDYLVKPISKRALFNIILKYASLKKQSINNFKNIHIEDNFENRIERSGLDKESFREIFSEFITNYKPILSEIKNALLERNFKKLEEISHSLKSSVGYLGTKKSFYLAHQLEICGKTFNLKKAQYYLNALEEELQKMQVEFYQNF
ncbi:hypothetical protein OSSY52_20420 [Tepiditoga spiralis]|uniref:histidine kinase n=1 Tax=Tepiditoga spiralis TaxID=2108365 RepID=A0A7G1G636_9BACT|nr:response regulator [Tepiditoga spiralis]BBE31901.1 hypothetical protein OSSY52_20420 [Tepiditoga spiralis]